VLRHRSRSSASRHWGRYIDAYTRLQALLAEARRAPGIEKRSLVGGEANVGCLVEVVETLEETYE
jgi:hypothetical protein